jgi:signal transduction histidine kinase
MVTMRERAQALGGHFEIQALPGRGTQLTVRVPR